MSTSVFQPINLKEIEVGKTYSGLVLINSYSKKLDMGSRAPLYGELVYQGKVMKFKIWDRNLQEMFNGNDYSGSILNVTTQIDTYNNQLEVTINSIDFNYDRTNTNLTMFYKSADVETLVREFTDFVNTKLSKEVSVIIANILNKDNLFDLYKTCWAGSRMHDAQIGGLLNHTLKMLRLATTLYRNDQRLHQYMELIYFGIIVHDIGKVQEIAPNGVYTKTSFVTHRTIGIEILHDFKEQIVQARGEHFYYSLLAIIQGHHGEWGDKPTTVWTQVVHLIDMLESQTTYFLDALENNDVKDRNGNLAVWSEGRYLVV